MKLGGKLAEQQLGKASSLKSIERREPSPCNFVANPNGRSALLPSTKYSGRYPWERKMLAHVLQKTKDLAVSVILF
jgi:hypothetical protein